MKNKLILIFLILAVIFLSGCISIGVPSAPITVDEKTENDIADILTVENVATYPSQPIMPDSKFTFSFDVKNIHNSAIARCLHVRLYDHSIFSFQNPANNNDVAAGKKCGYNNQSNPEEVVNKGDMFPGTTTRINYYLKSPSANEISNLRISPKINYRFTYDFTANTLYQIVVADGTYLANMQQAGKSVTAEPVNSIGPGPIKVYISLMNKDRMVLAGSTGQIKIEIKNEGSGASSSDWGGAIKAKSLTIGIPKNITSDIDFSNAEGNFEKVSCPEDFDPNYYECVTNNEKIHLYQGSSAPLIFRFNTKEINGPGKPEVPYRIYTFKAKLDYQYLIDRSYVIEVNPHVME